MPSSFYAHGRRKEICSYSCPRPARRVGRIDLHCSIAHADEDKMCHCMAHWRVAAKIMEMEDVL